MQNVSYKNVKKGLEHLSLFRYLEALLHGVLPLLFPSKLQVIKSFNLSANVNIREKI